LLSHIPKISICSPAQEAALEVRSLTPHWLDSLSLPQVLFFDFSKASRPFLSWPCGFVAVFFCFSGVFLRLKPPLLINNISIEFFFVTTSGVVELRWQQGTPVSE
jgi:hypothetical protein